MSWPGQARPSIVPLWMAPIRCRYGPEAGHDIDGCAPYNRLMNEFEIISRYFAPLAGEGAFGLKDDVALAPRRQGHDLVVTTDTIGEGTDFFAFDPPDTVAQKALRVNLSDLAA